MRAKVSFWGRGGVQGYLSPICSPFQELSPLSVSQPRSVAHEALAKLQAGYHRLSPTMPTRKTTELSQNWSGPGVGHHTLGPRGSLPCGSGSGVRKAYLGDWANCWAAVTASSSEVTSMGTLWQPGCLRTRSSCRTVLSTVVLAHRSTLLTTMKKGTFRARASPRCSLVVPAASEKEGRQ